MCTSALPEGTARIPSDAADDAARLRALCQSQEIELGTSDFSVEYDGVHYRVSRMAAQRGPVFVLRRMPTQVPRLESLRLNEEVTKALLVPRLTGLLLIAGRTGAGKTTTASALLVERIEMFGGVAVAAEDPPELPLEGFHRSGVCYQVWASQDRGGYPAVARQIVRWKPNVIMFGEVRDATTAEEAMKAAINGHLVISTIHADTVSGAIQRFHALASDLPQDSAAKLLSESLCAVMVQELMYVPELGILPQVQFLDFNFEDSGRGARTHVRTMSWQMLQAEVQHQENVRAFGRISQNIRAI